MRGAGEGEAARAAVCAHPLPSRAPSPSSPSGRCVAPFMSEQAQAKVCISRGVPPELAEALGGEAAVRRMVALVSEEGEGV